MKVRGHATMVAITWNGIDEARGFKFDSNVKPGPVPLRYWAQDPSSWDIKPKRKKPTNNGVITS